MAKNKEDQIIKRDIGEDGTVSPIKIVIGRAAKKNSPKYMRNDPQLLGKFKYPKIENDAYFSPPWTAEALRDLEPVTGTVWEPFVGDGALAKIFEATGNKVFCSDIKDYGYPHTWTLNFLRNNVNSFVLDMCEKRFPDWIVTNPPYFNCVVYVERMMELCEEFKGKSAFLMRNEFDCAKGRRHVFHDNPHFKGKIVLTSRPHWFEERKSSPRHNYAWYVWDYTKEYDIKYLKYSFRTEKSDGSVQYR